MIGWDRAGDSVVGNFSPRQLRWIAEHLDTYRAALRLEHEWREIECRLVSTVDAAELAPKHHQLAPADAPQRGLPALNVAREMSTGLTTRKLDQVDVVLSTLQTADGTVVLADPDQVWAWIWSLYECAMHLAARLGVSWEPSRMTTWNGMNRAERSFHRLSNWVMRVIDDLIVVADLPCPELDG